MKDRKPGAPGQYKGIITDIERQKMQSGKTFVITLTRDDQPIVAGTPYSKAAVLPDELAAVICPNIEDPTPADALAALLPRNGSSQMTGPLAMGGNKITGLGVPAAASDAATRQYVIDTAHIYRATYTGDIDDNTLNGVFWMRTTDCTGTFPADVPTFVFLAATGIYQRMSYFTNDGVSKILERYHRNGKWYGWKAVAMQSDIANMAEIDVLWSNSSPTSSFAAQTVTFNSGVDLNNYDYIGVICVYDINNQRRLPFWLSNVTITSSNIGYMNGHNPTDGTFVARTVTGMSATGMSFADAYKAGSSNNQVCIPYRILGFRRV